MTSPPGPVAGRGLSSAEAPTVTVLTGITRLMTVGSAPAAAGG